MEASAPQTVRHQKTERKAATSRLLRRQGRGLVYTAPPDGGYGWVVLVAAFFLQFVVYGTVFSAGVILIELLEVFQEGKGMTALTGSVTTGLMFGTGPFSTILTQKFGFRVTVTSGALLATTGCIISAFATHVYVLIISNGIITGFGFGLVCVPSFVVVGYYFNTRRPLAVALAATGSGTGTLAMPPLIRFLIRVFGWRGAFMISAGICLNMCVAASLLRPINSNTDGSSELNQGVKKGNNTTSTDIDNSRKSEHTRKLFDVSLLKDARQWTLILCDFLWNIGSLIFIVLLPDYAKVHGIPKDIVPWLVSVMGFTNILGKILIGFVPYTPRYDRLLMFALSTAGTGCAMLLVPVKPMLTTLMICSSLYGLCFGIQIAVIPIMITRVFGVDKLNSGLGLLFIGDGFGAALGPPAAGLFYDLTHDFNLLFVLAGILSLVSAGFLISLLVYQRRREKPRGNFREGEVNEVADTGFEITEEETSQEKS